MSGTFGLIALASSIAYASIRGSIRNKSDSRGNQQCAS